MPAGSWLAPLIGGAVLAALVGSGAELAWRAGGHRPSVDAEDLDLWAAERRRASTGDGDVIVVIGKSRALLDVDEPTIRARYPHTRVVQLARVGRGAFATFADLASDPTFKGRILFGVTEPDFTRQDEDGQRDGVERAHHLGPDALVNARVRAQVARRAVIRSAELTPLQVLGEAWQGRAPRPHFVTVAPDRSARADFSRVDVATLRAQVESVQQQSAQRMGAREVHPAPWLTDARRLRPLVEQLQARGGDVVFLQLPLAGSSARFSERFYPRRHFWDLLAQTLHATTLHYQDVETLRGFDCPDTSHLDGKDAPRFTGALLDELERVGFLRR